MKITTFLLLLLSSSSSSSLIAGFLSNGTSPLEPCGAPHNSGFQFQIVALSLLCVMSLVQLSFCSESIERFPSVVSRQFVALQIQCQWPQCLLLWQSTSYSTVTEFLCLDFYILIYFHTPFVLHSSPLVLLRQSTSKFYVIFLVIMSDPLARTSQYVFTSW